MDHRKIEERSLALHREIAIKIRENPCLLLDLKQRLEEDALREWFDILDHKPVSEIIELLIDPGEEAARLRQSSPFAGILSESERRRVFNRFYESARV